MAFQKAVFDENCYVFSARMRTQGLKLGTLLNPKARSTQLRVDIRGFSDILPKGSQLYPVFLLTAKLLR